MISCLFNIFFIFYYNLVKKLKIIYHFLACEELETVCSHSGLIKYHQLKAERDAAKVAPQVAPA